MKIKGRKIAIIALVVIAVALLYLYITNRSGGASGSEPGKGLTIVTPMPVSGYSVEDAATEDGFPEALPETLDEVDPTIGGDIDLPSGEDVITGAPALTEAPEEPAEVEEFSTYAPKNWRGNVL
jgi:hypothetical protein